MVEAYIKIAGQWRYPYYVVDKSGGTLGVLLTAKRDLAAAPLFLERAINLHGLADKINVAKKWI